MTSKSDKRGKGDHGMSKIEINSQHAPAAIGPYSQAINVDGTLYISGQLPICPETGAFYSEEIVGQTKQSLENIVAILKEAGGSMKNVVKTTVLLKDMNDFAAMNEVYAAYFEAPYPARAAFQVAKLPKDARVEIEAIAKL